MGSQKEMKKKFRRTQIPCRSSLRTWIAFASIFALTLGHGVAGADVLDYLAPWSVGSEFMYSWIEGQMGYDQQNAGFGTINQLRDDLGLPQDNQTYRVYATMRPLQHHMVRIFGSVPEIYKSQIRAQKDMRFTQLPGAIDPVNNNLTNTRVVVFPAGTLVKSEMRTAQFGFGYDLDFLVGPGHAAGMNGELRYIDLRLSVSDANALSVPSPSLIPPVFTPCGVGGDNICYQYYNTSLDELVPTIGAHAQAVLPFGFGNMFPDLTLGGYTRMNFGLWPNYLNYVDIQAGLQLNTGSKCGSRRFLIAKFGVEHQSLLHDGQFRTGRVLELKRDGLTCALEAVF
ncbi:MAG: hypothetical protein V1897_08160 [Pseudomonadota bacterium]